jgi:L-arabinose isomerase
VTTLAAIGLATLDYDGIPEGFADRRQREYAARIEALRRSFDDVLDLGIVGDHDAARRAAEQLAGSSPAALVVNPLIAARAGLIRPVLDATDVPVLVWGPPDHRSYPDDLAARDAMLGSAPVGAFAVGNLLARSGRPSRATSSEELGDREVVWLRAAVHARRFATMRFGMVGGWFQDMDDCHLDADRLRSELGPEIVDVSLDPSGRPDEPFAAAARLADALVAAAEGLDGMAVQCIADEVRGSRGFGVTACEGVSRLLSAGVPAACMGDLPTLIALSVAEGLTGTCHYTEVDGVDAARGAILLSNGGELDLRLAAEGATTCAQQFFPGALGRGTAWRAALRPGPASLIAFTPTHRGWRLVTMDGRITDDRLHGFPVPHGFFAGSSEPEALWDAFVEAGAPHHAAVAGRHVGDGAALWCRMTGVEHVRVG